MQNAPAIQDWSRAIGAGRLAVSRGVALAPEDRLRREIINRLMCDGRVDLDAIQQMHPTVPVDVAPELARLQPLIADGLVTVADRKIDMTEFGRPLLRVAAACFDQYLQDPLAMSSEAARSVDPRAAHSDRSGRYSRVI